LKISNNVTCILCPAGCKIFIEIEDGICINIEGNKCKKGIEYGINETLYQKRIVTSSILIINGIWPLVSVRTSDPIPKEKIFEILDIIKKTNICAPVKSGDIIIQDIANTGVDIVATRTIDIIKRK